jgi:hypothetical protein
VDATINKRRESHLVALNLDMLARYGLYVSLPESIEHISDNNPMHIVDEHDGDMFIP